MSSALGGNAIKGKLFIAYYYGLCVVALLAARVLHVVTTTSQDVALNLLREEAAEAGSQLSLKPRFLRPLTPVKLRKHLSFSSLFDFSCI